MEKFLIRKGKVDDDLWNAILTQSTGTNSEKIEAAKKIFRNYRNLPLVADDVLKSLAALTENEEVRKAIALEMVQEKIEIPGGLYLDLLATLSNDPNKEIKRILEPQYNKYIKEPFIGLQRLRQAIQNYELTAILGIARFVDEFNQAINTSLAPVMETFFKISKVLEEPEFKTFEYNWLGFLPIDQTIELYKMHKAGKDKEIEQTLVGLTEDEEYLEGFMNEVKTSDVFEPRTFIIQDAMDAHKEGKYSLSVPVLLAQIEGILWAYAEKKGVKFGDKIVTKDGKKKKLESAKLLLRETKVKDQLYKYITQEFLDKIYVKKFRHGILHGRIIEYNTEKNSMKLLLFLRALIEDCR